VLLLYWTSESGFQHAAEAHLYQTGVPHEIFNKGDTELIGV